MTLVLILLCIAVILAGAAIGKPIGWIVLGFALLALVMTIVGMPHISFR